MNNTDLGYFWYMQEQERVEREKQEKMKNYSNLLSSLGVEESHNKPKEENNIK